MTLKFRVQRLARALFTNTTVRLCTLVYLTWYSMHTFVIFRKFSFLDIGLQNIPTQERVGSLDFVDIKAPLCTVTPELKDGSTYSTTVRPFVNRRSIDRYDCKGSCQRTTSTCFLGYCLCHPGYGGLNCDLVKTVANPWYTIDCPNLHRLDGNTLDVHTPLSEIGGKACPVGEEGSMSTGLSYCAHLCYSSEMYGVPIVPFSIWKSAQQAESKLWGRSGSADGDRYQEHWEGFQDFAKLDLNFNLGSVVEFGAGPWTQFRGIIYKRPDVIIQEYTIIEPGANYYMENVTSCAYRSGRLRKYGSDELYEFPLNIFAERGESRSNAQLLYDTVISINVIEHVQNAVDYFHSLHSALRPGGMLIFHDRYYTNPPSGDAVLGANVYHPIRLTQLMFDVFLSDFDIIYNNCDGHNNIHGWLKRNANERGYYVIARKKR